MRKRATNHNHPDGHLMGAKVELDDDEWRGGEYTVTGLQSGSAVLTRGDGFQRLKPIYEIRNNA
jgi:hypothetical protein